MCFWHTFSLDYRDVDWLVEEISSSFLDGPIIVAKVLIKSGRSKLYRVARLDSTLPIREEERNGSIFEIDRNRFPRNVPEILLGISKEIVEIESRAYYLQRARLSPLKKKLWSHWHCASYLLREEAVQLSDSGSSIFPRVTDSQTSDKESLSLSRSTCPLTRITSQPVDYYHNAIFPFPWEGGGLKEGKYEVEWSSSVNKSVPVFIACRISLPGLALANEATRYIIFNGPSLRIKLYTTWMIYRSKRNDNRRIIAREADQPRTK